MIPPEDPSFLVRIYPPAMEGGKGRDYWIVVHEGRLDVRGRGMSAEEAIEDYFRELRRITSRGAM